MNQLSLLVKLLCAGHGGTVMSTAMQDKHQRRIVRLFREGKINLLVSTSVAEEGLDITECRLVVRFDLPKTEAGYIQSRGRARKEDSMYVLFVEQGNEVHMTLVHRLRNSERQMKMYAQHIKSVMECEADEDEDFISGTDMANMEIEEAEKKSKTRPSENLTSLEVKETGAKISGDAAVSLIHRYCMNLPHDQYCSLIPRFLFRSQTGDKNNQKQFQYQLTLPSNAPIKGPLVGAWSDSKARAKAAVALAACRELQLLNELDDCLLPQAAASPGDESRKKRKNMSADEAAAALEADWHIETNINPRVLVCADDRDAYLRLMRDGGRADKGGAGANAAPKAGPAREAPEDALPGLLRSSPRAPNGDFRLHLHAAEFEIIKPPDASADLVIPEALGVVACQPLPGPWRFPLFPESAEVSVALKYVGELALDPCALRDLKAFHLALCEGAYFKGKLLSQACTTSENGIQRRSFYGRIAADRVRYMSGGVTQALDGSPTRNLSWYLVAPLAGGSLGPVTPSGMPSRREGRGGANTRGGVAGDGRRGEPSQSEEAGGGRVRAAGWITGRKAGVRRRAVEEGMRSRIYGRPPKYVPCGGFPKVRGGEAGPRSPGGADGGLKDLGLGRGDGDGGGIGARDGRPARELIDWELVRSTAARLERVVASGIPREQWGCLVRGDIVMSTYNEGVYRLLGVRRDLSPKSSFPAKPDPRLMDRDLRKEAIRAQLSESMASPSAEAEVCEYETFEEYYAKRWGLSNLDSQQPLLECERMRTMSILKRARNSLRRGWNPLRALMEDEEEGAALEDTKEEAYQKKKQDSRWTKVVHLVPELVVLHPLHQTTWASLSMVLAVLWCLENLLKVQELGEFLCNSDIIERSIAIPDVQMLYESVTSKHCGEHCNYERLEFMGDALLKYAATMHLYWSFPEAHEGILTKKREAMVSNIRLAKVSQRLGLNRCLRHIRLGDHPWRPAGCHFLDAFWASVGGDMTNGAAWYGGRKGKAPPTQRQFETFKVKFKLLADAVESLIGAFYAHGGIKAGFAVIDRMGLVPAQYLFQYSEIFETRDDWLRDVVANPDATNIPEGMKSFAQTSSRARGFKGQRDMSGLEEIVKHKFQNKSLVLEAVTHCSWPHSEPPCYQRLEYLGDAVLDILVTRYMFHKYGDSNPGQLTHLRQAAVNNERLGLCAVKLGLQRFILHFSSYLQAHISEFVNQVERLSQEKAGRGGRASFGLGERQAPKVLGDIVEALIGATYLDAYGSFKATWAIWEPLLQPLHTPDTVPMHPVRELLELCQAFHWDVEFRRVRDRPGRRAQGEGGPGGPGGLRRQRGESDGGSDSDEGGEEEDDDEEEDDLELDAEVREAGSDEERAEERPDCSLREDGGVGGSRADFRKDRSGRRAVTDVTSEPLAIKVAVKAIVNGEIVAEGRGTHIRAARREAARNALEGSLSAYRGHRRDRRYSAVCSVER
eukprot:evm.model.scf_898EXC.5 EVM.evm.TU.scf_898EXC.5   scf_898EXC:44547-57562(-)